MNLRLIKWHNVKQNSLSAKANTYILLYTSNNTIWKFYEKYSDQENNPVENLSIYNVKGDNRQYVVSLSIHREAKVCCKSVFQSGSELYFLKPEIILLCPLKKTTKASTTILRWQISMFTSHEDNNYIVFNYVCYLPWYMFSNNLLNKIW